MGERSAVTSATTSEHTLPSRSRVLRALRALRLVHPFPTALNTLATIALACVAVRDLPALDVLVRLAVTMLAVQCAIGTVNDIVDHDLDAATKPWKPLPAGIISPRMARGCAAIAIGVALVMGASFGPAAWALSTLGMAVGLAYDLRLKRSAWSGLTYAVALPLVPLWVWTALDRFALGLLWVLPLGLVLGGALQLANALPDLEGDARHGVHGTAQWLGRRWALTAAWGGFGLAATLALLLGYALDSDTRVLLPGVVLALALLAAAVRVYLRRPSSAALQTGWSLLAPGAGILAVAWLAALR